MDPARDIREAQVVAKALKGTRVSTKVVEEPRANELPQNPGVRANAPRVQGIQKAQINVTELSHRGAYPGTNGIGGIHPHGVPPRLTHRVKVHRLTGRLGIPAERALPRAED